MIPLCLKTRMIRSRSAGDVALMKSGSVPLHDILSRTVEMELLTIVPKTPGSRVLCVSLSQGWMLGDRP